MYIYSLKYMHLGNLSELDFWDQSDIINASAVRKICFILVYFHYNNHNLAYFFTYFMSLCCITWNYVGGKFSDSCYKTLRKYKGF